MFLKTTLLLILSFNLYAYELQRNYYVDSKSITIADILPHTGSQKLLFQIENNRHTKRVKTKELLQLLAQNGYKDVSSRYPYIQFNLKSPIDTTNLINEIKEYYKKNYPTISFESIQIHPNSYVSKLPSKYDTVFRKRAYLSNHGILHIKEYENRKLYFTYAIQATIPALIARHDIQKGSEITKANSKKKSIILKKFPSKPLSSIKKGRYEAKHKIKKSSLITKRDVVGLTLIKRGSDVTVTLNEPHISITFLAKALRSATMGETIYVMQKNGKKIEVTVTGKNQAEVK